MTPAPDVVSEELVAPAWDAGRAPEVSVVVPTYDRAGFLDGLVEALEAQSLPWDRFEVVIVDNGSTDDTWAGLQRVAARTPLRLRVARVEPNRGPAAARDVGAALARAPVIAFTDDDCLPLPGWLAAILAPFADGADVVQGRTEPDGAEFGRAGPWDRTVWVTSATALFETCNIAYLKDVFSSLGGFTAGGGLVEDTHLRPFGEDVSLGWRCIEAGGAARFAGEAVVHHRMLPGSYTGWLREQRRLALFPPLIRRTPGLRQTLWGRVFLAPHTAAFDLAVVAGIAAVATRRPWLAAGALPWVASRWRPARRRRGRNTLVRLAQLGIGDGIGFGALVVGSIRNRRVVL
jgi:glycosyltransferase involved in cell wall biosynthesis